MTETELIGTGIKMLRKQMNMTLSDVAEATGFSVSYLSKVERSQGSLTLDALSKIAAAFDMELIEFLSMNFKNDVVHIRKDERKVVYNRDSIIKYELLTSGHNKRMKGLLVTLYPNDSTDFAKVTLAHTTDELAYILEGEMILAVVSKEGKSQQNLLKEGDSYYIYAGEKHALKCHGKKPCVSFWSYLSPPCFSDDNAFQH